jgi:hypothetical protein
MEDPQFEVMQITPEMAADWLGRKRRNRNIRQRNVDAIARDITSGRWRLNGDSVKFGPDGLLDDGQHRLMAVVQAGIAVPMLVMHGLSEEARHTVDSGMSRKYADMLAMAGYSQYGVLSSTVRRMWHWDHGFYMLHGGAAMVNPSYQELDDYLASLNGEIEHAVEYAMPVYKDARMTPTVLATLSIILPRSKNGDRAGHFLSGLVTGINLEEGSPILALRRKLARVDDKLIARSEGITQEDRRALACRAWKMWVEGKKTDSKRLVVPTGGFTNRNYPVPE